MDDSAGAMLSAIEEVGTVVDELRALRDKVKQYGDASKRLNDIGDVLDELNEGIGRIQGAFTSALAQVRETHASAMDSKESIKELLRAVPEIVERIESSDAVSSASHLVDSMSEIDGLLRAHEKLLAESAQRLSEQREMQAQALKNLTDAAARNGAAIGGLSTELNQLLQATAQGFELLGALHNGVNDDLIPNARATRSALGELITLTNQVQQGANKAADVMADYATKMLREMTSMRSELAVTYKLVTEQDKKIQAQGEFLEELSKKKKGWFS